MDGPEARTTALDDRCDIVAPDFLPLVGIPHASNGSVAGGAVSSKVRHSAKHCRHWTPTWVSGTAVSDRLSFIAVFLHCNTGG